MNIEEKKEMNLSLDGGNGFKIMRNPYIIIVGIAEYDKPTETLPV